MFWSSIYFLGLFGLALTVSPDWIKNLNDNSKLAQVKSQFDGPKELAGKLFGTNGTENVANVNEFIDELVNQLNKYIQTSGVNPYKIPSFETDLQLGLLSGWISLTEGSLNGLNTIERKGNALITYNNSNIQVHAVLGFSKLEYSYDYELKFLNFGPHGKAEGTSSDNEFDVDMNVNVTSLLMKLEKVDVKNIGSVTLKFNGSALTDWMINLLVTRILPILQKNIPILLGNFLNLGLGQVFNAFNNFVCGVLQNCPQEFLNATY